MSDIEVLKEVVDLLVAHGLRYWLGRGRFQWFVVHHKVGEHESDIDFHLFREDERVLRSLLPEFRARHYGITDDRSRHKISLAKTGVAVEFVFLDLDTTGKGVRYHETAFPLRKRFLCPNDVFKDRMVTIGGVLVRVPEEEYLTCVFGPRWRECRKGSGGVEI